MWWDVLIGNLIFWPLYVWICMMPERIMEYALENFEDE